QSPRLLGEDAMFGLPEICVENTHATDQHGHFRSGQRQQLCPVHQCLLCCHEMLLAASVVAEAVGTWFERGKGGDVGLLLRCVHASRGERHIHLDPCVLCSFFDRSVTAENDQIGKRNLLA